MFSECLLVAEVQMTSHTTSVDSSSASAGCHNDHQPIVPSVSENNAGNTSSAPVSSSSAFMTSAERRTSYKAILSQRIKVTFINKYNNVWLCLTLIN